MECLEIMPPRKSRAGCSEPQSSPQDRDVTPAPLLGMENLGFDLKAFVQSTLLESIRSSEEVKGALAMAVSSKERDVFSAVANVIQTNDNIVELIRELLKFATCIQNFKQKTGL